MIHHAQYIMAEIYKYIYIKREQFFYLASNWLLESIELSFFIFIIKFIICSKVEQHLFFSLSCVIVFSIIISKMMMMVIIMIYD